MEKFSLEKAQTEAQELEKKVQSGEARDYAEAEQIVDSKYYQDWIWKRPSDEEVAKFSNLDVNTMADTPISGPRSIKEEELKKLIQTTGNTRLVDLGSATTVFRSSDNQLKLEEAGVREYVGVDLGVKSSEFHARSSDTFEVEQKRKSDPTYQEPPPEQRVQLKSIHGEIVTTLHSLPDNYGNVWMTGLEDGNVIPYYDEWGFALFAELKRVVPENGFIFTDGGFADQVLEKCSLEFKEVRKALDKLYWMHNRFKPPTEEETASIPKLEEIIGKYESKEDDPYNLGGRIGRYVVDVPEVGFRIYFGSIQTGSWEEHIVIINTKKTREETKEIDKENAEVKHEYTEADFKRDIEAKRQMRNDSYDDYLDRHGPEWVANSKKKNSERPDIGFAQGIIERGFMLVPGYMTLEGSATTSLRHFYDVLNNPDKFSPEAVRQAERFKELRGDVERIFPTIPGSEKVLRILNEDYEEGFYKQKKGFDVLIKLYIALRNLGYSHYEISHPSELIGD